MVGFQSLLDYQYFSKRSKCQFGLKRIEYLGHCISLQGVEVDKSKIQAIVDWPIPQSLKAFRGFLGLSGFYRRFIKGYASIAGPLTDLLKICIHVE